MTTLKENETFSLTEYTAIKSKVYNGLSDYSKNELCDKSGGLNNMYNALYYYLVVRNLAKIKTNRNNYLLLDILIKGGFINS